MIDIISVYKGEYRLHPAKNKAEAHMVAQVQVSIAERSGGPWSVRMLRGPEPVWEDSSRKRLLEGKL